jgi:transmembrane sensor
MTTFAELPDRQQAQLEAAAQWRLRLRDDPALASTADFLDWIADPANYKLYQAVDAGWSQVGEFAASPELLDLRRDALGRAREQGAKRWLPHSNLRRMAAPILLAAAIGGGAAYFLMPEPGAYTTEIGERRVVALPDGSRISLDSNSGVQVHYSKTARTLELDRGRARFDVAHDVTRPFTVAAGPETVVAVGTSFNVERLGSKVLVTLIQGHIVVKSRVVASIGSILEPPLSLAAGEELVASPDVKPSISQTNLQSATAWEGGQLVFKDVTLAEAVERVNRYTGKPVMVDPSVAAIRISGVFNAGDVGSFVSAVTSYFPVQATTTSDSNILLQRRS